MQSSYATLHTAFYLSNINIKMLSKNSCIALSVWGVFQLESCEEFKAFSRNHVAIIPHKVGVSIRPFRSQIVRSFSI